MNYLSPNDMVFYKNMDTNTMMSGGYNIQSILLANQYDNNTLHNVNVDSSKMKEKFMLPIGLVYQPHKKSQCSHHTGKNMGNYENDTDLEDVSVLKNDIYDKLVDLVKVIPLLSRPTSNTKRFRGEKKSKTRKLKKI